jgi:hypothetical protein
MGRGEQRSALAIGDRGIMSMGAWFRRRWVSFASLLLLAGFIAAIWLLDPFHLGEASARLAARLDTVADPVERLRLEKDLLQFETDTRIRIGTTLVQIVGGIVAAGAAYFAWRNLRATQDRMNQDREGQITTRYTQAIGQLGAELSGGRPNLEVRLGGIYALERLARDSPTDHWPIMEVLCAYVRQHAPWPPASAPSHAAVGAAVQGPRADVQAVLTVLGRRLPPPGDRPPAMLDLRRTDLRGAELWNLRLEWVDFWGAHLDGARFWSARLRDVKLEYAHLQAAEFDNAAMERDVTFEGADLAQARLAGANLRGAGGPRGLAQSQLDAAVGSRTTQLPPGLQLPAHW